MWLTRFVCSPQKLLGASSFLFCVVFLLNYEVHEWHLNLTELWGSCGSQQLTFGSRRRFGGISWKSFFHMMFSWLSASAVWVAGSDVWWGSWTSRWDLGVLSEVGGWLCRNHSNPCKLWQQPSEVAPSCHHFPTPTWKLFVYTVIKCEFILLESLNVLHDCAIDCAFTLKFNHR